MAFESLTERLSGIFKKLRGQARLTEANMEDMLKEIRVALLEADVNYKVVKEFTNNVKEKALGQDVLNKLNPSQMLVKIVHDELIELLGSDDAEIKYQTGRPTIIMLVGLQGSGKTTTAGKLGYLLKNKLKKKVLFAACDVYRPAAIDQLDQIAKSIGVDIVNMGAKVNPVDIAKAAKKKAYDEDYNVLIIDTAGRLQIDEPLMQELNKEVALNWAHNPKSPEEIRQALRHLKYELCTGSFGAGRNNDLVHMAKKYAKAGRIHFLHLRNVLWTDDHDSFCEVGHCSKDGSLDMAKIVKALVDNGFDGYVRPDHGRNIFGEDGKPGYGLYDRALGAAYINGLFEMAEKNK